MTAAKPPLTCPTCSGPLSHYADKKYNGICPWCVRWDSNGAAYRQRFIRKYKRTGIYRNTRKS